MSSGFVTEKQANVLHMKERESLERKGLEKIDKVKKGVKF